MSASNMLNRANTLVNVGYGEDLPSRFPDSETWAKPIREAVTPIVKHGQRPIWEMILLIREAVTPMVKHEQSPICKVILLIYEVALLIHKLLHCITQITQIIFDYTDLKNILVNGARKLVTPLEKQEEYINEEMGILNRKGGKFLTRLYGNNEEFREEIINFVRDKKELDLKLILDKRCKTNTLNTLGNNYLAECITSKDNTKDLIEVMAKYYQRND